MKKEIMKFTCRVFKEKIFDAFICPILGDEFREDWIANDKEYIYSIDGRKYCLTVKVHGRSIHEKYSDKDFIRDLLKDDDQTKNLIAYYLEGRILSRQGA